ncbi:IS110 family transposase [Kriegella aquimaris]|uniref:IS110 family transposase n=1 Tax=Kriegella aquimaris TaxID=192904 RepID=UPI0015A1F1AA|nr:transposase [Kriegella aquimaris]
MDKYFPDHEVVTAYEAGCCGYHAHRCFEGYGWRSLVVNPADVHRKGKEKHTKTDRIDAQLIARELKDGRLDGIHVPDMEREQLRSLFRRRNDLVKDYRRIKSLIKSQLLYFGVAVPREFDNSHWSHGFRNWLDALNLSIPLPVRPLTAVCASSALWIKTCVMFQRNYEGSVRPITRRITSCSGVFRALVASLLAGSYVNWAT